MGNVISTKTKKIKNTCTSLILRQQCNNSEPCIGDEGFTIINIVNIVSTAPAFGRFASTWADLAIVLNLNSISIANWQERLNLNTLTIKIVLTKMLEEWVASSTTGPIKISVLIENLESAQMNDMAYKLRQELSNKYPNANPDGVVLNTDGSNLPSGSSSIANNNNCQSENEGLLTQVISRDNPDQQLTLVKPKNRKSKMCLGIGISITLVVILLVLGLTIYFVFYHKSDSNTQKPRTKSCGEHEWIKDNVEKDQELYPIDVSSYHSFQTLAEKVPDNQPISLAISYNGVGHWFHDRLLSKPCFIKQLNITGFFDFSFLSWILNQVTNVESIHLEITSCDEHDNRTIFSKLGQDNYITLPYLLNLTLSHSCANIWMYKFFAKTQMENLEVFKVNNGIVNEANIRYLRSIQRKCPKLKTFHLIAQLHTNELFYPSNHKATSLKEIKVENITSSKKSEYSRLILGDDFCDTFPELKIFQSTNSCISFIDRYLIFSCQSVRKLTLSICYADNEYYRLGIVQKLSHLEENDLYLVFPDGNCPPSNQLEDVRQEVYNSTIISNRVCSNCVIHSTRESYCVQ